jgi:hypothetical protein
VKNKIFHKCIFEFNGKCVGDRLIDDLSIHYGLDVINKCDTNGGM